MRHLTTLTLLCALTPLTPAAAQSDGARLRSSGRTPEIRLLCVADEAPLKHVVNAKGVELALFAAFDEEPPEVVHIRRDGVLKPIPMPRNAVSKPHSDGDGKSGKIEGYFIPMFAAQDNATAWAKANTPVKPQGGADSSSAKPQPPQWAKLAGAPQSDGKDYLVCLFQPSTKVKWFPPKVLNIDISPAVAPPGTLLVVNLSDRPTLIRVGTGKPITIPPGATHTQPAPVLDQPFPVAIAAKSRSGEQLRMMSNRQRTIAKGSVGILCLYSLYEQTSDKPVGVRFSTYEAQPEPVKNK